MTATQNAMHAIDASSHALANKANMPPGLTYMAGNDSRESGSRATERE